MGYMAEEIFFLRFHLLVFSFIISIILLILSPHLLRILLGWDGLGVTSYLLVIYFQRTKSFNAGIITALSNRIGDVLLLLSLGILSSWEIWNFSRTAITSQQIPMFAIRLIVVAACTKRAQIPFSAWLPAAMAAPTPVSSLVHSSTLVTAGVYLIIRFCPLLLHSGTQKWLLYIGVLTMLIAGRAALAENDMKKVIALSTLSQLGVMIRTLGAGFFNAAFFHLLSHAFFKALLFITVGNIIHMSLDFQDFRKASLAPKNCPLTLRINFAANLSLCGLPFTSGFFSKDLCIELFSSARINLGLVTLFLLATALTAAYTMRFIYVLALTYSKLLRFSNLSDKNFTMNFSILAILPLAISRGRLITWSLSLVPVSPLLAFSIKNFTLVIVVGSALFMIILLIKKIGTVKSYYSFFTYMWGLPLISRRLWAFSFLRQGAQLRSLVDLQWTPFLILSSVISITPTTTRRSLTQNLTIFIVFGGIWWFIFIGSWYLCVTSHPIYFKIKIQITHIQPKGKKP